jgi:hypothetical protein
MSVTVFWTACCNSQKKKSSNPIPSAREKLNESEYHITTEDTVVSRPKFV